MRTVACSCLALCTLGDWRAGLPTAHARRRCLERVLENAEGEKASGVKASACRCVVWGVGVDEIYGGSWLT